MIIDFLKSKVEFFKDFGVGLLALLVICFFIYMIAAPERFCVLIVGAILWGAYAAGKALRKNKRQTGSWFE